MTSNEWKEGEPARQGFYRARLEDGSHLIAEWREHKKGEGKKWWQWVSDDPTVAKSPAPLEGVVSYQMAARAEVEALMHRELTRDERIAKCFQDFSHHKSDWTHVPQPARRQLVVGQPVLIGALRNPKVAALHHDGQVVTIEYETVKKQHGEEIPCGIGYQTWHWMDLLPLRENVASLPLRKRREIVYSTSSLDHIVSRYFSNGMRADPRYQRDYVWKQEDRDRLIDSLFRGKDIGRFIFVRNPYPQPDEILDGKQRLDAMLGFFASAYPFQGVYWDELSKRDRYAIEGKSVQFAELNSEEVGEVGLLEAFLDVNEAGVPQTEAHLAKVRLMYEEARQREQENRQAA